MFNVQLLREPTLPFCPPQVGRSSDGRPDIQMLCLQIISLVWLWAQCKPTHNLFCVPAQQALDSLTLQAQ